MAGRLDLRDRVEAGRSQRIRDAGPGRRDLGVHRHDVDAAFVELRHRPLGGRDREADERFDLIALDAAGLHAQVDSARQIIRRRYGVPVNWFCYPSGHYDATVIAATKAYANALYTELDGINGGDLTALEEIGRAHV